MRKQRDKPSGIGTHRLPLETSYTQPLGSARTRGRAARQVAGGGGVREAGVDVQGRARGETLKKFFFKYGEYGQVIRSVFGLRPYLPALPKRNPHLPSRSS